MYKRWLSYFVVNPQFRRTGEIDHSVTNIRIYSNIFRHEYSFVSYSNQNFIFVTLWNICEHWWTFVNICEHLWIFVNICEHLWTLVNICEHLWTNVIICEHLWTFVNICKEMKKVFKPAVPPTTLMPAGLFPVATFPHCLKFKV